MLRVAVDKSSESSLIKSYIDDYHSKTGKWVKFRVEECSEIDSEISLLGYKPPAELMLTMISDYSGIPKKKIIEGGRKSNSVLLRGLISYLCVKMGIRLIDIGRVLGKRDHTTVIAAVTMFSNRIDTDILHKKILREAVDFIKENIQLYNPETNTLRMTAL
jgi:chromosomal replication initiation ATPase DnaA